jgi:hypothetical protein
MIYNFNALILQAFRKNNYGYFLVISIFLNQFDFDLEGKIKSFDNRGRKKVLWVF